MPGIILGTGHTTVANIGQKPQPSWTLHSINNIIVKYILYQIVINAMEKIRHGRKPVGNWGRAIVIYRMIRESLILIVTFEPRDEGRKGLDYADV